MHSSQHAASVRSLRGSDANTENLSFPPTQRLGLLGSSALAPQRSRDQVVNLRRSSRALLDMLNVQPLAHAAML